MPTRMNFMPTTELEKRQWLEEFKNNLPQIAIDLRLDPTEVQDIDNEVTLAIDNISNVYNKKNDFDVAVQKRDEHRDVFFPILVEFIRRIKANRYYSRSLGEAINIEVGVSTKLPKSISDNSKLSLTINTSAQRVVFNFKRPAKHSIRIYTRRAGEAEFALLMIVNNLTFEDLRPNLNNAAAEKREYCFTLSKNDKEGERSAIYPVAVLM